MFKRKVDHNGTPLSSYMIGSRDNKDISIEPVVTACTEYKEGISQVHGRREVLVQNSLYNPSRSIGTSSDIIQSFRVLPDHGESSYGITLLQGLDVADVVIELPIFLALKGDITIDTGNDSNNKIISKELSRLNYKQVLNKLLKYAKISSYGACLTVVTDNENLVPPLSSNENIVKFNIVADYAFIFTNYASPSEAWSRDYGQPRNFSIGGINADKSRYYHLIIDYDEYTGRGQNILSKNINSLMALNILELTYTYNLINSHLKIIKFPSEQTKKGVSPDRVKSDMMGYVDQIRNKATSQSVLAMPSDFTFEQHSLQLPTGLTAANEFHIAYLAMTSMTPELMLKGGSAGALATSEVNTRQYYSLIASREQEQMIRPSLKWMVECIIQDQNLSVDGFDIEFDPIYQPTEKEKLEIERMRIDLEIEKKSMEDIVDVGKDDIDSSDAI